MTGGDVSLHVALAIELSSTGIARSRVCAPPHVHINSQGSRPSLCMAVIPLFSCRAADMGNLTNFQGT